MTSITLTDEQLEHLADALAGRIADRLAERLAQTSPPQRVDAAGLAPMLGVSRGTVYQHADELGAIEVGGGSKPRLRFDPQQALEAWSARVSSDRSDASNGSGDGGSAMPPAPAERRLPNGPPQPGSVLPSRPAPRGRRRSSEDRKKARVAER